MKEETFYRKFANMPIVKRTIAVYYVGNHGVTQMSPLEMYRSLNEAMSKRRELDAEIKRLLVIAEKIMH